MTLGQLANKFSDIFPVRPLQLENVDKNAVALGQFANKFSGMLPVSPLQPENVA